MKSKKKTQVPNCPGVEMSHTGAEVSSIRLQVYMSLNISYISWPESTTTSLLSFPHIFFFFRYTILLQDVEDYVLKGQWCMLGGEAADLVSNSGSLILITNLTDSDMWCDAVFSSCVGKMECITQYKAMFCDIAKLVAWAINMAVTIIASVLFLFNHNKKRTFLFEIDKEIFVHPWKQRLCTFETVNSLI